MINQQNFLRRASQAGTSIEEVGFYLAWAALFLTYAALGVGFGFAVRIFWDGLTR